MNNADRILALLGRHPGIDDDELAELAGINPRQQVNQICRRLAEAGLIVRERGAFGKIANFPIPERLPVGPDALSGRPVEPEISSTSVVSESDHTIERAGDLRDMLFLMPCSGRKNASHAIERGGAPVTDDLPPALAQRLQEARSTVLAKAGLDESHPIPAWQRYGGTFYAAANRALADAVSQGLHVLILSGGYGVLKAGEAIGNYSMRLKRAVWPRGLLENVLSTYASRHQLKAVRALVSASTDYYQIVSRTEWRKSGISDIAILTPETSRGAMVKAPRAQGEAFAALLAGKFSEGWRSSDGLAMRVRVGN